MRSEADNQSGAIIGKARTGDRLLVTDYGNKWTGVVLPNGKRGYMMTENQTDGRDEQNRARSAFLRP